MSWVGSSGLDGVDQRVDVLGRGQAGLVVGCRPASDQRLVEDLGGGEHGDAVALHLGRPRRVRFGGVAADADQREAGVLGVGQGVFEAFGAVVETVVVGHGDHVDPGVAEGVERGGGRPERERLVGRATPVGDRGFEVGHGEVGVGHELGHGIEELERCVIEPGRQERLEVDVAAERDRDRPVAGCVIGCVMRCVTGCVIGCVNEQRLVGLGGGRRTVETRGVAEVRPCARRGRGGPAPSQGEERGHADERDEASPR